MEKIRIPLVTRANEPNVNGVVYSKECWDKMVQEVRKGNGDRKIPVTDVSYDEIKKCRPHDFFSMPSDNMLGYVYDFEDDFAIVDPISPSAAEKINEYLSSGNMGYMRYLADVSEKEDGTIIADINRIVAIDIEPSSLAKNL
jgi:hypothetical protein